MADMLRLRARDGVLYPHLQREASGVKSFIGHEYKLVAKGPAEDGSQDVCGFAPTGKVVELPIDGFTVEYARAMAEGDVLPADAAAAEICRKFTSKTVPVASSAPAPVANLKTASSDGGESGAEGAGKKG